MTTERHIYAAVHRRFLEDPANFKAALPFTPARLDEICTFRVLADGLEPTAWALLRVRDGDNGALERLALSDACLPVGYDMAVLSPDEAEFTDDNPTDGFKTNLRSYNQQEALEHLNLKVHRRHDLSGATPSETRFKAVAAKRVDAQWYEVELPIEMMS